MLRPLIFFVENLHIYLDALASLETMLRFIKCVINVFEI